MLTVDNAPAFLLGAGLIAPDAILYGNLEVTGTPRRNRNLRVTTTGRGGYLVKEPEDPHTVAVESLRVEAAFYRFCHAEPAAAPVAAWMPALAWADFAASRVVLELLEDAVPLWRHFGARGAERFPSEAAAAVGAALAALHRAFPSPGAADDPRLGFLGRPEPWVLSVHRPAPETLARLTAGHYQLLEILQGNPAVTEGLEALRREWRPSAVIHADVKLDNVLVLPRPDGGADAGHPVRLVDWELVQVGDPAWDIGSALHDHLAWWITNLPPAPSVEEMEARAAFPLAALRPSLRALWRGYREGAALEGGAAEELLARAVLFSGARLVQTAYEMAGSGWVLPAPSVLMLQVAAHLFADPARARAELYGLDPAEAP